MRLMRKISDLLDAWTDWIASPGAPVDAPADASAGDGAGEAEATAGPAPPPERPAPPPGGLKRRVAVLTDVVAISKDMGRIWPKVRAAVDGLGWLPPAGVPTSRAMKEVLDALLDNVLAAADASLTPGEEARRLRPVLRDLREALGLYAEHRVDSASYPDPASEPARLSRERFLARLSDRGLDHLAIDWADAGTIGASVVGALGRDLPADDARARYVVRTREGRRYLDMPAADQAARERRLGEPRIFVARVDVVGLVAASVCSRYEPGLRRATAEKLRHWIVENIPDLPTDLRRACADWMIDIRPERMRSWEPISVVEVTLPQLPFAAFEDALARRRLPADPSQAATIVKSAMAAFVQQQCDLHRTALEAVRNEYAAESRVEIAAEEQMAVATRAAASTMTTTRPQPAM
ncbi:hypothetical protein [Methylobacterium radiotolerans]|uniref:hypothetical protein n=1 Tax=Methylobacterium radiotolerans TaxID=31998 RepID=UPI0038CF8566